MKSIKRLKSFFVIVLIIYTSIMNNTAKGNIAPIERDKKMVICYTQQEGEILYLGNTCSSGTFACVSNPCY